MTPALSRLKALCADDAAAQGTECEQGTAVNLLEASRLALPALIEVVEAQARVIGAQDAWDRAFQGWILDQDSPTLKAQCDEARETINALSGALTAALANLEKAI